MSASTIVLALAISAAPVLPRTSGAAATINVHGFVPASCRVTTATATCNIAVVRRVVPARSGRPPVVLVSPLF
ncbi:hypothetical protein ACFQPG_07740 [Sphingomonas sp. GCM10030256]|uniref:hypothetical protein n=1 Tax=Sphingomonas sp. GCM10030256 TaxID=3273427 RepID=UPI00360699B9